MYTGRFLYVTGLVLAVGAAAIAAGIIALALSVGHDRTVTKTVTETVQYDADASVTDIADRMTGPVESGSGEQYADAISASCPVLDVYALADGAILVCHG